MIYEMDWNWSGALDEDEIKQAMGGELLSVTPKDKVATTWDNIKEGNIVY